MPVNNHPAMIGKVEGTVRIMYSIAKGLVASVSRFNQAQCAPSQTFLGNLGDAFMTLGHYFQLYFQHLKCFQNVINKCFSNYTSAPAK